MSINQQPQQEARAMHERAVVTGMLDLSTLEEQCMSEIENDCFGDLANAQFCIELLHLATRQGNQEAREAWQRCFCAILRGWLHRHPRKEELGRLGSEESYLAQAFARFWQTMAQRQRLECTALSTALKYLQASLQGVLVDTLRAEAVPKRIAALTSRNAGVLRPKAEMDARQWWACMQQLFPDVRERRVAYFVFHCHLSPRDIVCFAPQEFGDVQEICDVRRHLLERILRHSDPMS